MKVVVPPRIISMQPSLVPTSRSASVRSESILKDLSRKSGKVMSSRVPFITVMAMCVWVLMSPGMTMSPVASISRSAVPSYAGPTETILSPSTTTSPLSTRRCASWVTIHALRMAVIMHVRILGAGITLPSDAGRAGARPPRTEGGRRMA